WAGAWIAPAASGAVRLNPDPILRGFALRLVVDPGDDDARVLLPGDATPIAVRRGSIDELPLVERADPESPVSLRIAPGAAGDGSMRVGTKPVDPPAALDLGNLD